MNLPLRMTVLAAFALTTGPAVMAQTTVAQPEAAKPVKVEHVWVVFKTHFDLGYTDLAENVFARYRGPMMDHALAIIEQNRQQEPDKRFAWTVPGWPLYAQILGPQQDPERKTRIEQAIREGSLAVHALPMTLHTESFDYEDLVRGLGYSAAVARRYGRPLPIAAKMTDVPCHCWVLPTLLRHGGIRFLQVGCNAASQYPRFPMLFQWEGPDGSRVLCNYTRDYGSGIHPPKGWPAKNYLAMIMTGDNHGPPSAGEVAGIRQTAARELPGVTIHFGTLDDFTRAIEAEKPTLPVVRGDTPDTWIHGTMSMAAETAIARNIRPLEPALDTLDTELRGWGLKPGPLAEPLAKAYEQSLLYGEHTWGMSGGAGPRELFGAEWQKWLVAAAAEPLPPGGDFSQVPNGSKQKWLKSYQDHRNYIRKTEAIVRPELAARLGMLAKAVKLDGRRFIVYNPLPWKRSGIVQVPFSGHTVRDGERGPLVDVLEDGSFYAVDIPANGYKTFTVVDTTKEEVIFHLISAKQGADVDRFKTRFFKVALDHKRGGIASLIEKKTGRELVDKSSPYALGQFLHERFSANEVFDRFYKIYSRIQGSWGLNDFGKPGMPDATKSPYLATMPGPWETDYERPSADADIVTLFAIGNPGLAEEYKLTFTFSRHVPSVEVEWSVKDKTPEKLPEGGWLCFPFAVDKPHFTVGRPGGPIDPAHDIIPGTNRHLMAVASGVAITDAHDAGVVLCPLDSPLISLDRPGLWRWSMDFVPQKPSVFVNLYNNMWNTNFPMWQGGSWRERVRLWPIAAGSNVKKNLAINSWEARVPLLVAEAQGPGGTLPIAEDGLTLSRPGVLVTALGADPAGNPGTLVRVWEQAGDGGPLTVTLPQGLKAERAQPVDLRGEKSGAPLAIRDGSFRFELHAYAPASFLLQ